MRIHLRYTNPDGTEKDWIGEADSGGVTIWFGRVGQTKQNRFVPFANCHPTPQEELHRRADRKIKKGYRRNFSSDDPRKPVITTSPSPQKTPPVSAKISGAVSQWAQDTKEVWF